MAQLTTSGRTDSHVIYGAASRPVVQQDHCVFNGVKKTDIRCTT